MKFKQEIVDKLTPPIKLEAGKVQNVRTAESLKHSPPLLRKVQSTKWKLESDGLWFVWYWEPEPSGELTYDCGFSGIRVLNIQQYKDLL